MPQELEILENLKEPMALGEVFAKSGLFPDIKTQAQAAVKILAGRELGLSPFESMNGLYFVNNRLAMYANIMAGLVKKTKKYDYTVIKIDNTECSIDFFDTSDKEERKKLGNSTFTFKDAAQAGLANKEVWKNYPRNLMFARALANGVRWFAPDAISGYHVVEELDEVIDVPKENIVEITEKGEITNGKG